MSGSSSRSTEERAPSGPFSAPSWDIGPQTLIPAGRPLVMGILNLTPDSFHAPSRQQNTETAVRTAMEMAGGGADLLDLGAESTRPGAAPVSAEQELERLIPVLEAVRRETDLPITVDTVRALTAEAALECGASAVNDISGGADPAMFPLVARRGCGLILMHMQGTPRTMQDAPRYHDVTAEVAGWLAARCILAQEAGVPSERLVVDPGIGFGKTLEHNLALLTGLRTVAKDRPLLLGASRKSFIGQITGADTGDRLPGSLAALTAAFGHGATVVRVHDVGASVQFLEVMKAIF